MRSCATSGVTRLIERERTEQRLRDCIGPMTLQRVPRAEWLRKKNALPLKDVNLFRVAFELVALGPVFGTACAFFSRWKRSDRPN